jgi:hypothetical protein
LSSIEATSDELLGAYTRAEDDALTSAFGGRGKKRLNRVFDVIGYPHYCYPSRKQGKKRKTTASAISVVPKGKKIKVLTHRLRYIETATLPKLDEGTSSIVEAEQPAPAAPREDLSELPKVPAIGPAETLKLRVEAKEEVAKEPKLGEKVGLPKILSPPADSGLSKITRAPAIIPKRRRTASVLDAVIETTRELTPALAKKIAEAAINHAETEARPSAPAKTEPAATKDKAERESLDVGMDMEKDMEEKAKSPAPKAPSEDIDSTCFGKMTI